MPLVSFIFGSLAYITPWFAFVLLKRGLFFKKNWCLLIPFFSLLLILIISSLRRYIFPHWISPAFWILIPSSIIYSGNKLSDLESLIKMCKYTAVIWLVLTGILLLPGGLTNIKQIGKLFNIPAKAYVEVLFWEEFPNLIQKNSVLVQTIDTALKNKNVSCLEKQPIIGAYKWFVASQLEYHQVFAGAKVIDIDQNSSNFYLWRDNWSQYANCNIMLFVIGDKDIARESGNLLTIKNQITFHDLGDYTSINLHIIYARLKDRESLRNAQDSLIISPRY